MCYKMPMPSVGRNVPRLEGRAKVTGRAAYVDDLVFPRMLHGRTIRSTIAKGTVEDIRLRSLERDLVVVDHRSIPGRNVHAVIEDDQPMLVERRVAHREEPIVLLAHEDKEALLRARVDIRYREEAPLYDPRRSDKSFKTIDIVKGSVDLGFDQADVVVEGEYETGHQEQLYIETNGVIAVPEPDGGITVYGSLQCPYYVHKSLCVLLAMPADRVRVVQAETGGGFGGKEEYPSMVAGHAALLALAARRPVKLVYDRVEDLRATTKRHPSIVRHKTGVKSDGRLVAQEIDVLLDGGAYCTLSPVVLSRGVIHAAGPYRCDHVRIRGRVVRTNTPPNGAFRGFGAPQTQFAGEVHMERIADRLGMDSVELRRINAYRPGDTTPTGQELGQDTSALRVLEEAVRRTDFRRRRETRPADRGLGLALFWHGAGFTGSGEVLLASRASLELTEKGARIRVASTEIGQGTRTMHAQIVADTLGLPFEAIEVHAADTAAVPNSGPTVASRTCMVVGRILQRCAAEMRRRLGGLTPRAYLAQHGPLVVTESYQKPAAIEWDETSYRGDAYEAYAWGCDVAEVQLDPDTWEVRPLKVTAVCEIGKAIHPILAAGQIEGGTSQGVGWALLEEVVMRDGVMANSTLTDYIIPTTLDGPEIEAVMLENPYRHGPFGAKGVGELPADGPAPAVVNAIRNLGIDVRAIPATPERIMEVACASR